MHQCWQQSEGIMEMGRNAAAQVLLDRDALERPRSVESAFGTDLPAGCLKRSRQTTHQPNILLVEDDFDVREFLTLALESEGYHVEQAETAEDGLALMRGNRFELILTDYALPRKTGSTMLEEATMAGLLRATPAMMVTAHPSPKVVPGVEVIAKPIDLDYLFDRIRGMLGDS